MVSIYECDAFGNLKVEILIGFNYIHFFSLYLMSCFQKWQTQLFNRKLKKTNSWNGIYYFKSAKNFTSSYMVKVSEI